MKHEPPPQPNEPPWMNTFREIEASIAKQVDRYIKARRRDALIWFSSAMFGYGTGVLVIEGLRWWLQ